MLVKSFADFMKIQRHIAILRVGMQFSRAGQGAKGASPPTHMNCIPPLLHCTSMKQHWPGRFGYEDGQFKVYPTADAVIFITKG
jgi:hypothetical protein